MNVKSFIDTNIFVYSLAQDESVKKQKSIQLIQKLLGKGLVLSTQVIGEFFTVVTKKIKPGCSPDSAREFIQLLKNSDCDIVDVNFSIAMEAMEIHKINKLSYYDSLIISAAAYAQCEILYTEDLQHGQKLQGVRIVNPFA